MRQTSKNKGNISVNKEKQMLETKIVEAGEPLSTGKNKMFRNPCHKKLLQECRKLHQAADTPNNPSLTLSFTVCLTPWRQTGLTTTTTHHYRPCV